MTAVIPGNKKNQFNLLSQARRQSGSTFKTFVLAAAVEQGINPETTTYLSAPFFYRPDPNGNCEDGSWWCPETYDHSYTGWTTIERATLRSDNTVYAQLTLDVTPEAVAKMATQARRPLAARRRRRLRPVDRPRRDGRLAARHGLGVRDARGGRDLLRADGDPQGDPPDRRGQERGLGQAEAQARDLRRRRLRRSRKILEENVQYGTGVGANYGAPAAGKTGTTEEHSDAWFCGYTPRLGTTVWVGYPRGKIPMTSVHGIAVAGGTLPGPDLAALHELRDRAARAGRLPRAEGLPRVEGLRARPVRAVVRLLPGRRLHAAGDDDRDDETTETEPTDSVPDAPPASQPPPKQTPPCPPPPATTTPPPPPRRRRPPSPSCPDARRPARGGCGRTARGGLRRLRVGRGRTARAGATAVARTAARSARSSSRCSSLAFAAYLAGARADARARRRPFARCWSSPS